MFAAAGCTAGAVAVLLAGTAGGATGVAGTAGGDQHRPDSGIRGLVLYGPTCPVQRPDRTCERPYAATITVRREPAGSVAARVHSGADGHFTVRLTPGTYLLQPRNGRPYPRAQSQTLAVRRHEFTAVTVRFDSGIR